MGWRQEFWAGPLYGVPRDAAKAFSAATVQWVNSPSDGTSAVGGPSGALPVLGPSVEWRSPPTKTRQNSLRRAPLVVPTALGMFPVNYFPPCSRPSADPGRVTHLLACCGVPFMACHSRRKKIEFHYAVLYWTCIRQYEHRMHIRSVRKAHNSKAHATIHHLYRIQKIRLSWYLCSSAVRYRKPSVSASHRNQPRKAVPRLLLLTLPSFETVPKPGSRKGGEAALEITQAQCVCKCSTVM